MDRFALVRIVPALLATVALVLGGSTARGQVSDRLVTDRPDFSESVLTMSPGRFQIEAGYTFARDHGVTTHSIGEALLRIGLIKRLELRLGINSFGLTEGASGNERGFQDIFVGAKIGLVKADTRFNLLRPGVSLLVGTSLPTGQEEFGGEGVWPAAKLILGWSLTSRLSLGANLNASSVQVEGDRFGQFAGSLSLGLALADRWGAFLEYFGFTSSDVRGVDAGFLDTGLMFLVNDNLQLDVRGGIGLSDPDVNYFLGFGFGWRI